MPPFRIPFTSRKPVPNGVEIHDENARPQSGDAQNSSPYQSRSSIALGIKEKRQEPNEFKLSSVDSSGQYLPPSPKEETKSFWSKSPSGNSNHRSLFSEHEPFSISRESFESYRRSFDISGRSPILPAESFNSRTSLDSRNFLLTRPAINTNTFDRPEAVKDGDFEDVKLGEDASKQQPKKKSFLSRFSESNNEAGAQPENKSHHFHIPGRKRGQSGSGSELGEVQKPGNKSNPEAPAK